MFGIKELKESIDIRLREIENNTYGVKQLLRDQQEGEECCKKDCFNKIEQLEEKIDSIVNEYSTLRDLFKSIHFDDVIAKSEILSKKLEVRAEDNANMYKKLETMVNEFKGCISMSRACLKDAKEFQETKDRLEHELKLMSECRAEISRNTKHTKQLSEYANSLHNQHFKIEAIYKLLTPEHVEEIVETTPKKKPGRKPKASTTCKE